MTCSFDQLEGPMRFFLTSIAAVALLVGTCSTGFAADEKLTPQQEKMKACNTKAGDKKGDERKAFMSDCLKASATPSQQEKMKKCNADASAKALKGDERKTFMSSCLKG
jgi:Spy/CpxP family protein refolding chaperone